MTFMRTPTVYYTCISHQLNLYNYDFKCFEKRCLYYIVTTEQSVNNYPLFASDSRNVHSWRHKYTVMPQLVRTFCRLVRSLCRLVTYFNVFILEKSNIKCVFFYPVNAI